MNVLITGAGSVMGQSIYKALAMADFGEQINIHFANSDILGAGRYFSHPFAPVVATPIFPLAVADEYEEVLNRYVDRNSIDIVFSGTQHELSKIAKFRDRTLKAATVPSVIADICLDKVKTASTLIRYGVRAPITFTLREYMNQARTIEGPVVVKPNHSSSSRNIFRVKDRQAVAKLIADGAVNPDGFLVQELLTGEEFTCGCYIDRYTKEINHITFKRTLTPDGATFYGEIVENPEIGHYLADVGHALVTEGLDFGHVNIQLILTESGPVLFEINGRLSSTEASKAHYGFNSCAAFIFNIVKQQPCTEWPIAHTGRFLRFYEEIYFD